MHSVSFFVNSLAVTCVLNVENENNIISPTTEPYMVQLFRHNTFNTNVYSTSADIYSQYMKTGNKYSYGISSKSIDILKMASSHLLQTNSLGVNGLEVLGKLCWS